jgi:hypothetical protein
VNEQLMSQLQNNPQVQQAINQAVEGLSQNPEITLETVDQMIKMFEFVMQKPEAYPQLRQQAIQSGQLDEQDLPPEYDESVIAIFLMALQALKRRMSQSGGAPQMGQMEPQMPQMAPQGQPPMQPQGGAPAFARGGLNQVAAAGRRGDTQLAHINPFEAQILRAHGGSGTVNPETGLPEFGFLSSLWKGVKEVAKVALPIAATFVAPYLAPYLGGSMLAAGAVTGGLGAALSGGNIGQGALLGGMSSGLGNMAGSAANNALGMGLGKTGEAVLGGGLMGGLGGELTGQGFAKGATQGALGQYAGAQLGNAGSNVGGSMGAGISAGGQQFGNMMTAGYSPMQSAMGGGLSGLATGLMKPSETVLNSIKSPKSLAPMGSGQYDSGSPTGFEMVTQGGMNPQGAQAASSPMNYTAPQPKTSMGLPGFSGADSGGFGFNANTAMKAIGLASMLGGSGAPREAQEAIKVMSPAQQEYFTRPSVKWDWGKMQTDAASNNQSLSQYMAENWNQVSGGAYNSPQPQKLAQGGPLAQVARLVKGSGSGRADTIDARLSDGEYVMDAETVSMLGDGSTQAGAQRLDQMREQLRAHKGAALSKGKFSPNAKSPLSYLKGAK